MGEARAPGAGDDGCDRASQTGADRIRLIAERRVRAVEDQRVPSGLQPEAFAAIRSLLDVIQRVGVDGEPQRVFEMIEEYLRARLAVPVDNV